MIRVTYDWRPRSKNSFVLRVEGHSTATACAAVSAFVAIIVAGFNAIAKMYPRNVKLYRTMR